VNVRLRLFAVARQLAGADVVEVSLAEGATVGDLRRQLAAQVPQLAALAPYLMFAIESAYAEDHARIPHNAEVACIPPVSGG
jgi:molybdopterin converting factor small subunit